MKTQMSRFQIHDDLTAPEASLPVAQGRPRRRRPAPELPRRPGRFPRRAARLRALPVRAAQQRHADAQDARADRARRRRAVRLRAPGSRSTRRTGRQAGLGLDEVSLAREWDSRDDREAALLRYLRPLAEQRGSVRATCSRRPARPAGPTSSCSRRSRSSRSRASPPWSTSPATCPPTARWRTRASCARPKRHEPGRTPPQEVAVATLERPGECCPKLHEAVELVGKRWTGAIVYVLLEGGAMRFSRDRRARCRTSPTACCPSA